MPTHVEPGNLIERLQAAASAAIANEAPSLERGPGTLKSLTVEFDLKRTGEIIESRAFVERQGVHRPPSSQRQGG